MQETDEIDLWARAVWMLILTTIRFLMLVILRVHRDYHQGFNILASSRRRGQSSFGRHFVQEITTLFGQALTTSCSVYSVASLSSAVAKASPFGQQGPRWKESIWYYPHKTTVLPSHFPRASVFAHEQTHPCVRVCVHQRAEET